MASHGNAGASPAARNGAVYAGLPVLPLGSGAPPAAASAPRNVVSWLGPIVSDVPAVCLAGSGPPPGASDGAASAELRLASRAPSAARDDAPYADVAVAHRRSGVADQHELLSAAAVNFVIDVPQGPTATEQDGGYGQVFPDGRNRGDGDTAGAFTERVRRGLPALGLAAASLAVAGLTAGVAATPATAFGLLAALLGGLSLATIGVLRA